jgi:repressor LexA
MPDRNELTAKQLKVLKMVEQEIARTGHPPAFRAIAKHLGVKAVGTIQDHISKLIEFGFLEKEKAPARGFKLPFQTRVTWIPVLGSVPAGNPTEAIASAIDEHEGKIALTGHWKGNIFALKVKGESMREKGILDGDLVIVQNQPDAETGQIVVAMVDQEATIKTLEKKNGKLRLLPANPDFQPIELHADRENRIVGKVIAVQRTYEK